MPALPFARLTRRGRIRRLGAIARRALEERGLERASLRFLADDTNILFRAWAGDGAFVVRIGVYGPIAHSLPEAQGETAWLTALRASGLTVPDPVPDLTGRLVTPIALPGVDGERLVVVFRWIPGSLLDERLAPGTLRAYGALAARLHRHAAAFRPPGDPPLPRYDRLFPFDQPEVLFTAGDTPLLPSERRAVFAEAAGRVEEAVGRLRSGEPMRLLHGDLHVWNVLVHRGRLAPIDFEDLMWGWPIQDIGTALYYLHHRPDFPAILEGFRRGYEEVAPWPEAEPGDLDTFIAGRALVLANDVLQMPPADLGDLDVPEFFARAERRLRATLEGGRFQG
ncbi:MAG: phosphotransferase [Acidimicrobiia bacterium]|nr:phosphotransferase [Acidimicrobiia bacterium]